MLHGYHYQWTFAPYEILTIHSYRLDLEHIQLISCLLDSGHKILDKA